MNTILFLGIIAVLHVIEVNMINISRNLSDLGQFWYIEGSPFIMYPFLITT